MVSIVIATKNREKSLKKCLESLKRQTYKNFEVVVKRGGRSLAEARQMGFEKSRGAIVIYIDDDCEVTKDWLKEIVLTFKDKKVGGVSGPTIVGRDEMKNRDVFKYSGVSYLSNLSFLSRIAGRIYRNIILEGRGMEIGRICKSGMWTMGADFYKITNYQLPPRQSSGPRFGSAITNKLIPVDYLEACNMALRRSLIEKVGGFDLNFKGTSEWCEVDLAMRVKKMGYRLVFNPRAVLYHHVSREGVFGERVNAKVRMENFLRYFKKHGKMNWRFIVCVLFLNGYWIYKFLTTRNIRWLGGLTGLKISSILKSDEKQRLYFN